ncbi:neuferricin-like isoform X2 [Paramacrobiotus metropolitanus]|uniref:neuferricin-like isoform X2 n=1 Tax=Paramacrobiotus metropolitanus TaxID=2943436 RepID=UPI0024458EF5|nr:neuferricin-like isoform X2 [Paramacrobiotus metropolitanus]
MRIMMAKLFLPRKVPISTVPDLFSRSAVSRSSAALLKIIFLLSSVVLVFIMVAQPDFFSSIITTYLPSELKRVPKSTPAEGIVNHDGINIYTKEELARHSGDDPSKPILLAYMGKVYDVTKGKRHYGPGGSYSFFAGKDATRSFLTGDFKNDLTDNLDDLPDSLFGQIETWADTYSKSADYKEVGVLCGEFYHCAGTPDAGKPTEKLLHVYQMIEKAKSDEAKENEVYKEFPQCNSEWSQDKGGRLWCSPKSGGIERTWSGVPRLLLTQKPGGAKSTRCACVHPEKLSDPRLEAYPGCHPDAESCAMPK